MGLTQPWFLAIAAVGVAALLLAFFLGRRRAVRHTFSAVSLLPGGAGAIRSTLPWLDFSLMVLVLLLAATSTAAPLVFRPQPVPVGFVVEPATLAGTGPNKVRSVAVAAAATLDSGQNWGLFTTESEPVAWGTGGQALAGALLAYRAPAWLQGQPPNTLLQTVTTMQKKYGSSPVLIVVGGQDTYASLEGRTAAGEELARMGIQVVRLGLEQAADPVYFSSIEAPGLVALGGEMAVRIEVVNTTASAVTADVRLTSGGAVVAMADLRLAPAGKAVQILKVTLPAVGLYQYHVSVAGPGEMAETVTREVLVLPAARAVIIASSSTASPLYLDRALKASPLVEKVTIIEPELLNASRLRESLRDAAVLVMDGVDAGRFPAPMPAEVRAWVEEGGVLVFAFGPAVTTAWNGNGLTDILPPFRGIMTEGLKGPVSEPHPLVSGLYLESVPLQVWKWLALDVSRDQALISVGEKPMLTLRSVGKGSVLVWASTTNPVENNWALHPSFPAFWSNIVAYAEGGEASLPALDWATTQARVGPHPPGTPSPGVVYVPYAAGQPVVLPEEALAPVRARSVASGDFHLPVIATTLAALAGLVYLGIRRRNTLP